MMTALKASLLALYTTSPWQDRLFIRIRLLLSDLFFIEQHVPKQGQILDVGCGHGLFANLLAIASSERQVLGFDIDTTKIPTAQATIGNRSNIRFTVGDAVALPQGQFNAITIIDVLYQIEPVIQRRILQYCAHALKPGGVLVWKTHSRKPRWKYTFTCLQERVGALIGTMKAPDLHFLSDEESLQALVAVGLTPVAVPMPSWRPYSDMVLLGKRS
jgi:2-polyprenyl-3-methyl-5-hydroxy-6-metoxy-1,4-benzoquinol methylase